MTHDDVLNHYFEWLYRRVCGGRFSQSVSYRKLLMHLHHTQFRYSIPNDADRAGSGVNLRWRFVCDNGYHQSVVDDMEGPCSVLEMMIALAIYCEEHITDDTDFGDRTGQWFWGMITTLGLGGMDDNRFDRGYVEDAITRFLDRKYDPDGKGGLFRIRYCEHDLRRVPIFHQLCWYLNSIS